MQTETMTPTMMPTTAQANNAHQDIPGNPSTPTSSRHNLNDRSTGKPLRVLSEADWQFWLENGYVVVKQAVPRKQADALAALLWEFEEKDPANPDTWYAPARAEMKMKELTNSGMVEMYNHPLMWQTGKHPAFMMPLWMSGAWKTCGSPLTAPT